MATSADKAVNDAQKSSLKTGKRDCPNCGLPQPIRKRVCGGCNEQFVPKPKRKQQDIGAMGKTSVTEQRRLLEKRANILHMHHNADIVILMHSRHGRGNTVTCFGTEGAGVAFIGNKQNVKQSGEGHMVEKLFTKFMQGLINDCMIQIIYLDWNFVDCAEIRKLLSQILHRQSYTSTLHIIV
ncbi:uncharacterized protein LOC110232032 [Exaiptasia diaphana]|uniref:Uncharacterized protein n=1 Tax=Exaiptasia diaphana TaxID=2652724 RepID=A0A913WQY9_EXADI|nr:uncharacterized protein LOC110232032 [Exaiptasia diaphana]